MKVALTVQIYLINSSEFYKRGYRMIQPQSVGTLMEKVVNSGDTFHDVSSFIFNNLQLFRKLNCSYRSSSGVWTARSAGTPASRRPTPRFWPPSWPRSPAAPGPTPSLSPWTRSPWPPCRWCESYTWFYHVFWQKLFLVSSPMHFQWEVESTVQSSAWEGSWFKRNAWSRFEIGCVCG